MLERPSRLNTALAFLVLLLAAGTANGQVARVSGVVRDVSGQPLRGALVTVDAGGGSTTAATDDNGRFSIIGVRSGVWTFEVQAPGYLTETGEMTVRSLGAQNQPVTIGLRRSGSVNTGPLAGLPGRDLQSQLSAAHSLFDEQRWDEAIAAYRSVLARAPSLTAINLQVATAHRHRKDYAAAIESYQAVLKTEPANEQALIGISTANLERGDSQAAEQVLLAAAEGDRAGRQIFFSLAELRSSQGRSAEAIDYYQKAADADPSWGKPLYRLGELAATSGAETDAARYLGEAIAVDPLSPEAALAKTALDRLNNK